MPSELVYQHTQQTPINGTISGMAPPGNETGYYYIPIANLPWQTSWQKLKDHVRTVCSVEHVEINEDSTSGHVVLKGRANFEAAFRLLNGGIFHDRALIADGRNVDSWVLIKQHVDGSAPLQPSSGSGLVTAAPIQQAPSLMAQPSPTFGEWSATSASQYCMMSPSPDTSLYFAPSTMPEQNPIPLYGIGSCALEHSRAVVSSAIPYPSGPAYVQYVPSEYYGNTYLTIPHNDIAPPEANHYHVAAVPSKRRKIIIRQLPTWTSESQIRELIRHKAGSASEKLQKLDVPLADGQQGINRGYAIATFGSEDAAEKAIRRLNDYQYEEHVLEVKYTKEGVFDQQSSHGHRSGHQRPPHHSHHHSRRERQDEKDKKGKGKEKERDAKPTSSGEKKSKSSLSGSDVIIAHGSSLSPRLTRET